MKAMILRRVQAIADPTSDPLELVDLPVPTPSPGDLLVKVIACGVCHTELDEIEGRLPAQLPVVPGHEVVGRVEARGDAATGFSVGDRVGVGWIHSSSGASDENLSDQFRATGCDVDGGYAEFMTVPASYAVPIPDSLPDLQAAPLMCAGAIGYRALRLSGLMDGQPLGLMGFGGSAHLVLQTVRHLFPSSPVHVFDRNEAVREFSLELGATSAGSIDSTPPSPLRAIIDTTPAWKPVVAAMRNLAPGGRLVINAIRKEERDKQALLDLSYHDHLWMEREIKSVANLTRNDIAEFLPLAASIPISPTIQDFELEQANEALRDLRAGGMKGAHVLRVSDEAR